MHSSPTPADAAPAPPPALLDREALLTRARQLQRADAGASTPALLRGKHLGLICEAGSGDDARLFCSAAGALGASVARIRPSVSELGSTSGNTLQHTARVLGRLYDGIECQGLAPALVQRLGRDAGVPVFDGLATTQHPSAALASLLDAGDPVEKRRLLIVQAVLLCSLR